jgi:hypothetical protein
MLLYVVNLKLSSFQTFLSLFATTVIIIVYACMNAIFPSNSRSPSIAEAARVLRHMETGIYFALVIMVVDATRKLHTAIASAPYHDTTLRVSIISLQYKCAR